MKKKEMNTSERKSKINFEKLFDEDLDTILCCGLDPNPPEDNPPEDDDDYNIGALGRYLRENDKEFSDLTPEEIEMFRIKK